MGFLVDRCWASAALAHRARRVWSSIREGWHDFAFLFRPGASVEEVLAAEAEVGRLPLSIRAIMQKCQGANVPALAAPFGNPAMDLLPLSKWFLLCPELQKEDFGLIDDVRRIVIAQKDFGGEPTLLLRVDTW